MISGAKGAAGVGAPNVTTGFVKALRTCDEGIGECFGDRSRRPETQKRDPWAKQPSHLGWGHHSVFLRTDGTAWAVGSFACPLFWNGPDGDAGRNNYGQLGDRSFVRRSSSAHSVVEPSSRYAMLHTVSHGGCLMLLVQGEMLLSLRTQHKVHSSTWIASSVTFASIWNFSNVLQSCLKDDGWPNTTSSGHCKQFVWALCFLFKINTSWCRMRFSVM